MNIPLTPIRFLRHAGEQYAPKTAVVCGDDRFTYAEFASRATRLAGALQNAGIRAGERVALGHERNTRAGRLRRLRL